MKIRPWKKIRSRAKAKRARAEDMALLTPIVNELLSTITVSEHNDPAQLSRIAFELYARDKQEVTRIKSSRIENTYGHRFDRFLAEVRGGQSPLTGADGIDVLKTCNLFLGLANPLNDSGLDIGSHFRMSSSFSKKGRTLYNAVKTFRPSTIVEIGTAYGMSAQFLLAASCRFAPEAQLHTIEADEPQFSLARKTISARYGDRAKCYRGLSADVIPQVANAVETIDLVFHDGAHDGRIYQSDFEALLPRLRSGSIILFDDIRWFDKHIVSEDPNCYAGWTAIVGRPEVALAAEIGSSVGVAMIGAR